MEAAVNAIHPSPATPEAVTKPRQDPAGNVDPGRGQRLAALQAGGFRTLPGYLLVALGVLYGWQRRGDVYLSPEQGVGYALGILGAAMMVLLLLYPLRKHARWMRGLGQVRHWFRAHMLLGITGPVCILYHCNFQLGSLNGNIALFSMLLVSFSGLLGRYFYTRIHYGLYGGRADLARLGGDAAVIRNHMHRIFAADPGLHGILNRLEALALRQQEGLAGSFLHVVRVAIGSRWSGMSARVRLRRARRVIARRDGMDAEELRRLRRASSYYLGVYLVTIRRVAGFTFYERLFSLWHVLHLPLFVMLLVSGSVHVYAVHLY